MLLQFCDTAKQKQLFFKSFLKRLVYLMLYISQEFA